MRRYGPGTLEPRPRAPMPASKKARKTIDNAAVAKSAGLAFIGQSGAMVEAVSLLVFTWLYPTAVVGLFFTLYAALKVLGAVTEAAMSTAQQRYTPAAKSRAEEARIVKAAVLVSLLGGIGIGALVFIFAPAIASFLEGGPVSQAELVAMVRIYVFALPFLTLVEVLTASVRAQQAFGPEIRVRVFYEQMLRLLLGVGLFFAGVSVNGLVLAHALSSFGAFVLSVSLARRFYDVRQVLRARLDAAFLKDFLSFSALMMPANIIKKFFLVGPVIIVNKALGPDAAAIFGLGRHISSILQVVHLSFDYVMAPYASLKHALARKDELKELYNFTTRIIVALVVPFGAWLIFASRDILTVFNPDYVAAGGVIVLLTAGRVTEALCGTATAMVEMLGRKFLPVINNVLGLIALFVLQYYLKVDWGVYGIALATSVGINVVSILSLAETWYFSGLLPYRRATLRPLIVSLGLTAVMVALFYAIAPLPHILHVVIGALSVVAVVKVLVRFGLSEEDARALGRIGRWFRKLRPDPKDFSLK